MVFDTMIHTNVKIAESPSYNRPVQLYAPNSQAAVPISDLTDEILARLKAMSGSENIDLITEKGGVSAAGWGENPDKCLIASKNLFPKGRRGVLASPSSPSPRKKFHPDLTGSYLDRLFADYDKQTKELKAESGEAEISEAETLRAASSCSNKRQQKCREDTAPVPASAEASPPAPALHPVPFPPPKIKRPLTARRWKLLPRAVRRTRPAQREVGFRGTPSTSSSACANCRRPRGPPESD